MLGRSIGTGPAVALAARLRACAACVLLSPYCAMREVASNVVAHYTGYVLPHALTTGIGAVAISDWWRTLDVVSRGEIGCPTMLIHGKADRLMPFHHSVLIRQALNRAQARAGAGGVEGMSLVLSGEKENAPRPKMPIRRHRQIRGIV